MPSLELILKKKGHGVRAAAPTTGRLLRYSQGRKAHARTCTVLRCASQSATSEGVTAPNLPTPARMRPRTHDDMRRRHLWMPITGALVALLVGLGLIDWLRPAVVRHTGERIETVAEAVMPAISSHVVIVSIDGLRPDAILRYRAPTLQWLLDSGRATLRAQTVVPSKTLPSHTSMLTGASLEQHGITWNEPRTHAALHVETIFERARSHGLVTAGFFSKPKMEMLATGDGYDYVQWPVGGRMGILGRNLRNGVQALLRTDRPNLLFVHIGEPDYIGHITGWMTPFYGNAVRTADAVLADIIVAADAAYGTDEYTLIVTADHGGHGRDHTGPGAADVLIPWIVAGKGVHGAGELRTLVRTFDTGPTALWLLGVPIDEALAGRPVREAFDLMDESLIAGDTTTAPR